VRHLWIDQRSVPFEHTTLIIDEDRHLRLVVYAQQQQEAGRE